MPFRRSMFGLVAAGLALLFLAGTTTTAFACATPMMNAHGATKPDCGHTQTASDCALVCATGCAALEPALPIHATLAPPLPVFADHLAPFLASKRYGPEPPPPRGEWLFENLNRI